MENALKDATLGTMENVAARNPRVVVIGGGFGGLKAALGLAKSSVQVLLLDRKNHHIFQPLLYQVALAALSPADIAAPIRRAVHGKKNVEVLIGTVTGFDLEQRTIHLEEGDDISYDYAVVATGATHSYFGHDDWATLAPGLKTIEDATEIRRRVLLAFELAERESLLDGQHCPLNFVIVGGGPTGVELAGAIVEISRHVLSQDFHGIDPRQARVILVEGGPRVLPAYSEDLSASAQRQLEALGVEVHTNTMVTNIEPGLVYVGDKRMESAVTLWAAGVMASPLGQALGAKLDRSGRVFVNDRLNIESHPEIFVIGDLAHFEQNGAPVPGVAPVAIQMGEYVAKEIRRRVSGQPSKPFSYWDKGSMATIGRSKGIAQIGKIHLSGLIAWSAWLFIHLIYLIGYRNRFFVLLNWAWQYLSWQSGARLITGSDELPGWHGRAGPAVEEDKRQAAG
ncbi:MAG TPA: NAD(P)/FAD-dependent oxidoreductase [Terriglobales bacterium]|nr:NAD(P)/FAD-dependent oxidoreductase [Terriglobales bacterium]